MMGLVIRVVEDVVACGDNTLLADALFASHCMLFGLIIHDTVNSCIVTTMLARRGDRSVPALFELLHLFST